VTVVTFSLFGFSSLRQRLWAFSQMGLAKPALRKIPELQLFQADGNGVRRGIFHPAEFRRLYAAGGMAIAGDRTRSGSGQRKSLLRATAQHRRPDGDTLYLEPVSPPAANGTGINSRSAQEAREQTPAAGCDDPRLDPAVQADPLLEPRFRRYPMRLSANRPGVS
jgi:hypothetical protein